MSQSDSVYTTTQAILDNAATLATRSRVRSVCITPAVQQAHRDLMASLAQLTPNVIVGFEADRFDVLERADHLKAILAAVYNYVKVIVQDTKDYTSVVIHDETAGLVDAASDINGAFMNACDRMLEAQALAAE
jgi:hypothetical protein